MDSFPGPDNAGGNVIHGKLKKLFAGVKFSGEELIELNNNLDYRLSLLHHALEYVSFLDLQFPECMIFDTEDWKNDLALKIGNGNDSTAKSKLAKFKQVYGYIMDIELFPSPLCGQGFYYTKTRQISSDDIY